MPIILHSFTNKPCKLFVLLYLRIMKHLLDWKLACLSLLGDKGKGYCKVHFLFSLND